MLQHTSSLDEIQSIKVNVPFDTEILPAKQKQLQIQIASQSIPQPTLVMSKQNKQLHIEIKPTTVHFLLRNKSKVRIIVPSSYHQSFILHTEGNLTISGVRIKQTWSIDRLAIQSTAGITKLDHLLLNQLMYKGTTGSLYGDQLKAHTSNFNILSGNLNLDQYTGKLDANIVSGKVQIELKELIKPTHIKVISGNIRLSLPPSSAFSLDAITEHGHISGKIPIRGLTTKQHWKGDYGQGKWPIRIENKSGNISIQ
ncbi:lia operon protein LiaG [Seinonella peptonophila]|uniref:Lia operon protein LiaG n=2 Tax=Seinonella peptonophila TaxID=112248 RepID=A0A1M4XLE1_9BACL|nr:lia operon protein LiaG [Seinonella peptonophila]